MFCKFQVPSRWKLVDKLWSAFTNECVANVMFHLAENSLTNCDPLSPTNVVQIAENSLTNCDLRSLTNVLQMSGSISLKTHRQIVSRVRQRMCCKCQVPSRWKLVDKLWSAFINECAANVRFHLAENSLTNCDPLSLTNVLQMSGSISLKTRWQIVIRFH